MSSDESSEAEDVGEDTQSRKVDMVALRKDLSDLPMGELSSLKDKVGLKTYNEVLFGASGSAGSKKKQFSRANKNRPSEVSSKKRVSSFREIFPQKKKVSRDPRFDDLSGTFNEEYFRKSYSFLSDMKDNEIQVLHKKLKKTTDSEKKAKLKQLIDRMEQQQKNDKTKQVKQEKKREWKKQEQEQVKQGKKPFYVKQSDLKQQELVEKYKELKESGRLQKYMEKKRKKNTSKDRKRLPSSFS